MLCILKIQNNNIRLLKNIYTYVCMCKEKGCGNMSKRQHSHRDEKCQLEVIMGLK